LIIFTSSLAAAAHPDSHSLIVMKDMPRAIDDIHIDKDDDGLHEDYDPHANPDTPGPEDVQIIEDKVEDKEEVEDKPGDEPDDEPGDAGIIENDTKSTTLTIPSQEWHNQIIMNKRQKKLMATKPSAITSPMTRSMTTSRPLTKKWKPKPGTETVQEAKTVQEADKNEEANLNEELDEKHGPRSGKHSLRA
jgi:hypothetical protein